MRFSLLSLNLHDEQQVDRNQSVLRIARYMAENNVGCTCLQGVTADNAAESLVVELGRLGLKYDYVWDVTDQYQDGSAIVTQLPILASESRTIAQSESSGGRPHRVIAARLAVSPDVSIDVFNLDMGPSGPESDAEISALIDFVAESPEVFLSKQVSGPVKRGPGRPRAKPASRGPGTRLACVAGDFGQDQQGVTGVLMKKAGFLNATATLRSDQASAAFSTGTRLDGAWVDDVYLKPAIRPNAVSSVFSGEDQQPVGSHLGLIVEFEV